MTEKDQKWNKFLDALRPAVNAYNFLIAIRNQGEDPPVCLVRDTDTEGEVIAEWDIDNCLNQFTFLNDGKIEWTLFEDGKVVAYALRDEKGVTFQKRPLSCN